MDSISSLSDTALLQMLLKSNPPQAQAASQPDITALSDSGLLEALKQGQGTTPPANVSTSGDIAKSAGIGLARGVIGLAGLPGDFANVASRGYDYFTGSDTNSTVAPYAKAIGSENLQKHVEDLTGEFYTPKTTAGEFAQTAGEFLPALIGGPESVATKLATRVAAPAIASEAAGQLTKGTSAEPYARIIGAVAGGMAPSAISRVISPATVDAVNAGAINTLQNEGVQLTAGQKTNSRVLKYMESELGDSLGAGGKATAANEQAAEQFTQAALRRAGVNAPRATREVMDDAFANNSDAFNSVAARNPAIPVPPSFWADVSNVASDYENLTGARSPLIQSLTDRLTNSAISPTQPVGTGIPATISGQAYQSIQSDIARYARSTSQPELKLALYDLRSALDDAVGQGLQTIGNSKDALAWQGARQQYKNLLVLERALSSSSEAANKGLITPAALLNADKAVNGVRNLVRGNSTYSDLATAGNAMLKPLPQSGTAPRAAAHLLPSIIGAGLGAGLGDITGILGGVAAPAVIGRTIMSGPVQRYLANQVAVPLRQNPQSLNSRLMRSILALPGAQNP